MGLFDKKFCSVCGNKVGTLFHRKLEDGYLCKDWEEETPLHHAGLMDTCLKLELTWNICDHVALAGYVAYYDFLFDRQIRDASRGYEAHGRWDESWNFIGGLSLSVSF